MPARIWKMRRRRRRCRRRWRRGSSWAPGGRGSSRRRGRRRRRRETTAGAAESARAHPRAGGGSTRGVREGEGVAPPPSRCLGASTWRQTRRFHVAARPNLFFSSANPPASMEGPPPVADEVSARIAGFGATIPAGAVSALAADVEALSGEKAPATLAQKRAFIANWHHDNGAPSARPQTAPVGTPSRPAPSPKPPARPTPPPPPPTPPPRDPSPPADRPAHEPSPASEPSPALEPPTHEPPAVTISSPHASSPPSFSPEQLVLAIGRAHEQGATAAQLHSLAGAVASLSGMAVPRGNIGQGAISPDL